MNKLVEKIITDFVDACPYSKTGFALWKSNELGHAYCTCAPRKPTRAMIAALRKEIEA